ncbi:MAG TPA: hypothetical protein VGP26_22780 [Actinophytocola sp.]|jgi:hypothetical protein|nr:hypothetical protein [Actinophytocola sp.]
MQTTTCEILSSFFFNGADAPATGNVNIDVLDSQTNTGLAAVAPTTISWCDGRPTALDA